jgi:cysteinyl-tRNA synthetase
MQLYNTKTRQLEAFRPLKENEIKIYSCGPTVYNYVHLGNLRTFVFEDIVVKTLIFLGYPVKTVMNITDVDDKTIRASMQAGEKLADFTQKYSDIFLQDIKKM